MLEALTETVLAGLENVAHYLSGHVLTSLIPAFLIAGAIGAFVRKETVLRYFGAHVKKHVSYSVASVSGLILAVCSCTILPLFTGIYRKGSGIGPATAFLFAGPGINLLAIVYTAQILGWDIGAARAGFAVLMALVIGLLMAATFSDKAAGGGFETPSQPSQRPRRVTLALFALLVALLLVGSASIPTAVKAAAMLVLIALLLALLLLRFGREETEEWGHETWDLGKKIFPLLILGTFLVGALAVWLPPETFGPYLGGNDPLSVFTGALAGLVLYMPTLLEVPIVGTTLGYEQGIIGAGPALALLLAGPTVSLPSIIVLQRIMGSRRMLLYVGLTLLFSTIAGIIYGNFIV